MRQISMNIVCKELYSMTVLSMIYLIMCGPSKINVGSWKLVHIYFSLIYVCVCVVTTYSGSQKEQVKGKEIVNMSTIGT